MIEDEERPDPIKEHEECEDAGDDCGGGEGLHEDSINQEKESVTAAKKNTPLFGALS